MGIPEYLTCLLRNLYVGQEVTVRTSYRSSDWFKIEKGVQLGCLPSPCLFDLYAEHIRGNDRLHELQAGIKIAGRNTSNPRYADDTILMAENEEEIKNILMKVKEGSERVGFWPHYCMANGRVKGGSGNSFPFLGLQNRLGW